MTFDKFPLHDTILKNILKMGYSTPTQIQSQIMPLALEGKDVSGLSRTGTGKTAAFLIPTIHRLTQLPPETIALCLAPTRELAQQIQEEAKRIGADLGFGTVSVVGGMSSEDQISALKNGARLVTGTPGRIIDLYKERALDLANVAVLVFDEADRMFDMGFVKDMHYILSKTNPKRQILLFSATMNFSVLNMIYEYGANPEEINVSRDQMTADKIEQVLYHVGDREKPGALLAVCKKHSPENGSIIVFVNYKERVPWVAAFLTKNGIPAQGLSSLLRQDKRNRIVQGFKSGNFRALVATDVASRGLDVDDVSLVVNYHLPEEAATFVHRIGRTARAGRHGIAVSICSSEDAYNQIRVEEFLGNKIPVQWLGEEEMPKEVLFPQREEEDREDEVEEGNPSSSHSPRHSSHGRRERAPSQRREERRPPRPAKLERPDRDGDISPSRPIPRDSAVIPPPPPKVGSSHSEPPYEKQDGRRDPQRSARNSRDPRESRRERGPRSPLQKDSRGRPRPEEGSFPPVDLPSPLTGNPIIYDMKSGKPKNRTETDYKKAVSQYESRLKTAEEKYSGKKKSAPAIIQKISSKVTALFGSRGK